MEHTIVEQRKVFFLYPHSVIQDSLLGVLTQAEFEVAMINDHAKIPFLLQKFQKSILFINIETALDAQGWESFVKSLKADEVSSQVVIGILVYNANPELAQKYLMDIGVTGGFITLKLGLGESAKIILKTLDANEARGGRKFVRVKCHESKTSLNFGYAGQLMHGDLLDISSAGFACIMEKDFVAGTELVDIQLKLWGSLVKVSGTVVGRRKNESGKDVHVIMFSESLDRNTKAKIYTFIQKSVQSEIDQLIQ